MSENQSRENYQGIAETINLNDENTVSAAIGFYGYIKNFFKALRLGFSSKNDKSALSGILERLYRRILCARIRLVAVFMLSFSIMAILISYVTNGTLGSFLSDIDTFSGLALLVVSLVLFTSNKNIHQSLINSKFLGLLSIVYNEQLAEDESFPYQNSTPFFLGIICGIFTVIYPVSIICAFILAIITSILIFNRPECGMLIIIAILPLLSVPLLLSFTCITFLGLLYKYLLGKRHIDFDVSAFLICMAAVYVIIRCSLSEGSLVSSRFCMYIAFFISCVSATNLIRSTAMFRRTFNVILNMTRTFTIILCLYYLGNMFFGTDAVSRFISMIGVESFTHSLTSTSFVSPFLAMAFPVNFAYIFGTGRHNKTAENVFFLVLLFASLLYVSSFTLILISILSCVAILFFYNKKYAFLVIPAPFAAYALFRLFNAVPVTYRVSAASESVSELQVALKSIKERPFFGAGPEITDYTGNMLLNILATFGFVGLILIFAFLIYITVTTTRSISAHIMKSDRARFLSIGMLCSQLSFVAFCIFTDIYCDLNTIFMFSAILSASFVSGKCYKSDYIDRSFVREYNHK